MKLKSKLVALFSLSIVVVIAFYGINLSLRSATLPSSKMTAPLIERLGNHNHLVTTASPLAQRYFNQGLVMAYGFNHAEAVRSFQAAIAADPNCAMCHWGLAYVLGPNINAAMEAGNVPTAYEAIQQARRLSNQATEAEQAYIAAMAKRYSAQPVADRKPLDKAFATAAEEVAKTYPDDLDAQTLYAEALMDTMPWDYWQADGKPRPETVKVLDTLEAVMAKNPNYPWALHLYIHAVEKQHPELGIAAADRLGNLVPAAGHLVHMPSHIYIRVGRYHDAVVANQKAVKADLDYVTQCHVQGLYQVAYMPHNHHFLWFAALMGGEKEQALAAAYKTANVDTKMLKEPGMGALQHYLVTPLYTQIKFEKWSEILATPAPDADLAYATGVWYYAQGMAYAGTGQSEKAARSLSQLEAVLASDEIKDITIWDIDKAVDVLNIAAEVLRGEMLVGANDYEGAIAHLTQAVAQEDALQYSEPATWSSPVRQSLGKVLLKANRPIEAEKLYRADLAIYPENSWSLKGLAESLNAQEKTAES